MEREPFPLFDYLETPFPCALDIAVLHDVIHFSRLNESARAAICETSVSPRRADLFLRFAQRMAHVARVEHRVRLAEAGLVALVVVGHNASARTIWHLMARLYASTAALTPNPERVFHRVTELAGASAVRSLLVGFVCRDSDGRVI